MFDDLKEKIDGVVSSVKSKLPGSKSDDDDEEYEDEEFDEKTEEIDVSEKLDESDDEYDEDEDEDEEDDEDEAKAKKQKMMRLGLVAIVLVLGASILMEDGGEEEEALPAPAPIARKRPKRKKKPIKKNIEKEAQVVKEESAPPAVVEKSPAEPAPTPEPVAEEENIAQTPPVEDSPQEGTESNTQEVVVKNELKLKDDGDQEQKAQEVEALGQDGFEKTPSEQETVLGESTPESGSSSDDMSTALDNLTETDTPKMIEKVVKEKLEYQEPPSYLETGRGLVYNCSGKHWACVDQTSYINCKKNNDWSKENEKAPECYPSNVYSNFTDCRTIQIYNINTTIETDFCKK
ncbi:hypothetical protein [Halobacteriovorax marinus]|uniref:hypothetical protein n=1 Tax=Halobacteriovorax marinus TaxID=97084 RepID=UPI003A8EC15A